MAQIFDIKRFAVHDGDGIRTTVFLKGCPLRCQWCHNPESFVMKSQLALFADKCVHCGLCAQSCQHGVHDFSKGHHLHRELCVACGECIHSCPVKALEVYGRNVTVADILPELLSDREFYEGTGGGITLSGGECLMQPEFCTELLKTLKENGINTAVDTCGYVSREVVDMVIPYTDTFLYDIKAIDKDVHIKCTGVSNETILDNFRYIYSQGKDIEVRIPYVPGWNDGEMEAIAQFLSEHPNIKGVRVLAYHNYAASKYTSLGLPLELPENVPSTEEMKAAKACLKAHGVTVLG